MVVLKANDFYWETRMGQVHELMWGNKITLKSINPNLDITSQNTKVAFIFALVYVVSFFKNHSSSCTPTGLDGVGLGRAQ